MTNDERVRMRQFICAVEQSDPGEDPLSEAAAPATPDKTDRQVLTELADLAFRLRAHSEAEDSEHALGVEDGMSRAAEMVENLIRRLHERT